MARRNIRPRPEPTWTPPALSTRALAALWAVPERRIRETLAKHPEVPRSALGRDLLLSDAAVRQLLDVLRVEPGAPESIDDTHDDDDDDDAPQTSDAVLLALGLRRAQ